MHINGAMGFFGDFSNRTFGAGALGNGTAIKGGAVADKQQRETELPCRKCALGKATLCGALTRGVSHRPKECHFRQIPYDAAENEIIYGKDTTPSDIFAVCQGWALRFVELADGRRQNLAVLLPGDICLAALFEDELHFSVQAVTKLRITRFARADLMKHILGDAHSLELYGRACAAQLRDADERAVDLGRRSAEERVSRLILGLVDRISEHRVLPNHPYAFPLLQRHVADLTGLTPVHVSRVMTELRNAGLIRLTQRSLMITNLTGLEQIGRLH
jgi:CRP/FNR family transcriptional regulator, anaerobic regulatory protein